jgi:pimeloyl-ACP methyl ester carboxylesterase
MKRVIKFVLKSLTVVIAAAIVAGIIYERWGQRQDRKRFSQIGQSIDIGGRTLNLYCSGEGSPTVILEGGYSWITVQPEIAKFTRACWYDRAGHGWSDPGPYPRTSAAITGDLHELLRVAAIPPPYVLVGASFGGFPVRVFAAKYKEEVAGVVLVDASHEDQHEPPSMQASTSRLPSTVRNALCALLPTMGQIGLVRFMSGAAAHREPPSGMSAEQATYFYLLSDLPKASVTSGNESCNWETSANEARTAGGLGDRSLIVLTAGKAFVPDEPGAAKEAAAFHQVWVNELQPKLARLSTRGRQIIVATSGHGIQFEAPDAVIGAIREIVAEIRAK